MNYGELINTVLLFYWIIYTFLVLLQGSLLGSHVMVVGEKKTLEKKIWEN